MNKTTKGSLAAGAAAVLLLGGAGSLAYWTDSAIVNGGAINSGYLTLDAVPFETDIVTGESTQDCSDIVYAAGAKQAGVEVKNFVPGDIVTTTCTFVIKAEGDNLAAEPTVPKTLNISTAPEDGATPAGGTGASFDAIVDVSYELDNATYVYDGSNPITENAADQTLKAAIQVTIPYGSADFLSDGSPNASVKNGNQTQNITASLANLTVSLTQLNPNP